MFLDMGPNTIIQLVVAVGGQIGLLFLFQYLRKIRKDFKTLKEYLLLVNLQYQTAEKIVKQTDKDPNTVSKFERIFEYVGRGIELVTEMINTDENEFMSEEQKVQYIQNKIVSKIKELIKEQEGENSELLDEEMIQSTVLYILKFISPLLVTKQKSVTPTPVV